MRHITLSDDEFNYLLLVLGWATGKAVLGGEEGALITSNRVLELANALNRENPNWTPYKIEGGRNE